jgi:hypothetical protein
MADIRLASRVGDPIVNHLIHRVDEQEARIVAMEAKLPVPLLPPVFPALDQSLSEMRPTLTSLITMEMVTPPSRAEIVVVRVE